MPPPSLPPGIYYALLAALLAVVSDTCLKLVGQGYPVWQLVFANVAGAQLFVFWPLLTLRREWGVLKTPLLRFHLLRAAFGLVAVFTATIAIRLLPLPMFYSLCFTAPLVKTLMASVVVRERITGAIFGLLMLGFAGTLLIIQPDAAFKLESDTLLGVGMTAAFVLSYTCSVLVIRSRLQGEPSLTMSFYPSFVDLVVAGGLLLVLGGKAFTWPDLALNVAVGVVGALANLALVTAYKRAPVAAVSPMQYTEMVWGVAASYVFWNHLPTPLTLAGAALIILASWLVGRMRRFA